MNKLILLFIWLCLVFCPNLSDGQDLSVSSYNQLTRLVSDKKIIGLGEPEHFYKGYYQLKSELVKHLVKNCAVNLLAFEASLNGMKEIDSFIQGKNEIHWSSALRSLNQPYDLEKSGLFDSQQIVDLFLWLKEYNRTAPVKVKVIGIDFQNFEIPAKEISKQLLAANATSDAIKVQDYQSKMRDLLKQIVANGPMVTTKSSWITDYQQLRNSISGLNAKHAKASNQDFFRELIQLSSVFDHPKFPRDSMMYSNLEMLLSENDKAVVWAANFHLENDVAFANVVKKLGVFLKESYGIHYFNIGLSESADQQPEIIYPAQDKKYDLLINCRKLESCVRLPD